MWFGKGIHDIVLCIMYNHEKVKCVIVGYSVYFVHGGDLFAAYYTILNCMMYMLSHLLSGIAVHIVHLHHTFLLGYVSLPLSLSVCVNVFSLPSSGLNNV